MARTTRMERFAKYASLRWSDKKQEWQLRFGTAHVVYRNSSFYWAMVWSKALSDAEGIPLRLIAPSTLELPGISNEAGEIDLGGLE